jgi:hypothetical protein
MYSDYEGNSHVLLDNLPSLIATRKRPKGRNWFGPIKSYLLRHLTTKWRIPKVGAFSLAQGKLSGIEVGSCALVWYTTQRP